MNILIIKHGSLGDLIVSFGAMKTLRVNYPNSNIYLLTQSNYKKTFKNLPYVNKICIDNRLAIFSSVKNLLRMVKEKKINLVIDLQNSTRTEIYNFFLKIFTKCKILSARKFSSYKYKQKKLGIQHISKNHQEQLKQLGINHFLQPDLNWMLKDDIKASKKVIFIPGASKSGEYKKWPSDKFAQVAKYLVLRKYEIYLTGSDLDLNTINEIIKLCPESMNKINESKIEDFYQLCMTSVLILTNDTGPAHIAGLTNKNVIWIANDNDISRSCYPLGDNVHKITSSNVKNISVDTITNKIEQILI